jgi:hypothetical protein
VTCYQRHLGDLFEALGLEYDQANRRRVDDAIREILGIGPDGHCPEVWAALKALDGDSRARLPALVSQRLG